MLQFHRQLTIAAIFAVALSISLPASATTLTEALVAAYSDSGELNAARAELRATNEGVPQALSGYRPSISASGDVGVNYTEPVAAGSNTTFPRGVSISLEQPIFRGFRTKNSVAIAEKAVLAGREVLRNVEQDVLLSAVTAFMDVAQAQAVLSLRTQNLEFLREQVRASKDRLNVGEGTRTDVAQTEARLSIGLSDHSAAAATLAAANATYQLVVGMPPKSIGAVKSVDFLLASSLDQAIGIAGIEHPAIGAAGYNVDIASYNVKVIKGEFLPTVSLVGEASHRDGGTTGHTDSASIIGSVKIPLYQAGEPDARARAAIETLGQRRIEHKLSGDRIRQLVVASWSSLDAAKAQIKAADAQVIAQQLVLSGVIEERNVGQRTTLDVLDAQQDLIDARVSQVRARRNRVVAAYSLLAATGGLSAAKLGLPVEIHDPTEHFHQVRDKWGGLRTPDAR